MGYEVSKHGRLGASARPARLHSTSAVVVSPPTTAGLSGLDAPTGPAAVVSSPTLRLSARVSSMHCGSGEENWTGPTPKLPLAACYGLMAPVGPMVA